jgi:dipeptidyl-peptidase-4
MRRPVGSSVLVYAIFLLVWASAPLVCEAQHTAAQAPASTATSAYKPLTVDRIYSEPSLNGRLTRGIQWTPDSKQISFFESNATGKVGRTELWVVDVASGQRHAILSAEKLESVLPADSEPTTQTTGLGRRAPAEYQWAPGGGALLFQGPNSLAWFDLKTQASRTLVAGKERITDPKISPDGKYVSFVRNHNLWVVSVADGKERAFTEGGTEEVRKGELDWVYPEELEITTAYWWAPDSSAIAYFQMDESKVAKYPLVDFSSPVGEAEEERYPPAGGANPLVRVFVAPVGGGEAHAMDTGENTDIYIARVNWLTDSKHIAIQRLNRPQTVLDLLVCDAATGAARTALNETDQYWINVSNDLHFLKDGKRFLWSSERSGYRHLYLYDLEGKQLAQITKGEWEVSAVDAVDEGKGLVYFTGTAKSPLERHLYRVSLDGSAISRITIHNGTHAVSMAPDASAFVDTYSDVLTPPRQDVARADGSLLRVINENKVAELADYHLSTPQFLSVKVHDGVALNAVMIKPPNFDESKKYPVLVYTYGGPHVQVVLNAWGGNMALWNQSMAQKGYIIFSLDNRGSAGRGHIFEEPIHYNLGAVELSDQREGVAYLKSLPYVDGERIGIWGWSYGGSMTLHAMFSVGAPFKAGFAGGPVTDWHFYDSIYTERYLGMPQQNETSYRTSSPIDRAENLKGKLLIAHGTDDDNVHFANTLTLIDKLIEVGKYAEVMPVPGRGHGASDPAARKVVFNRVTQFFLDNL